MIEVTDEMRNALIDYRSKHCTTTDDELIKHIIELHEANKPKSEPVGYVKTVGGYPDESEHRVEWVVKYKELKDNQPLYTTPPTRERLSEHELNNILFNLSKGSTLFDFARLVEQAHGIGVTNAQPQAIPTR